MNLKQAKRYLKDRGFTFKRNVTHGYLYTDGISNVLFNPKRIDDRRAWKNFEQDIRHALKKRKDSEMRRIVHIDNRNGHLVPQPVKLTPQQMEIASKPRYIPSDKPISEPIPYMKPKTRRKLRRQTAEQLARMTKRLKELIEIGLSNAEIVLKMREEGYTMSNGDPLDSKWVQFNVRKLGYNADRKIPKKDIIVEPIQVPAVIKKVINKLPEAVLATFTDPDLTEQQRYRMVMNYANVAPVPDAVKRILNSKELNDIEKMAMLHGFVEP